MCLSAPPIYRLFLRSSSLLKDSAAQKTADAFIVMHEDSFAGLLCVIHGAASRL